MSAHSTATVESPATPLPPNSAAGVTPNTAGDFKPDKGRYTRLLLGWTLVALVIMGAGIIVSLWLSGGGVTAVKDPATLFTSIGRITGLLGAYLLLLQILLLARLPFVQWVVPFDRLTIIHSA